MSTSQGFHSQSVTRPGTFRTSCDAKFKGEMLPLDQPHCDKYHMEKSLRHWNISHDHVKYLCFQLSYESIVSQGGRMLFFHCGDEHRSWISFSEMSLRLHKMISHQTHKDLFQLISQFVPFRIYSISTQFGLIINEQKTKYLRCTKKNCAMDDININSMHLEQVKSFKANCCQRKLN